MTQSVVSPRKFCLDANLSWRAADALKAVDLPFTHISEHFPHKIHGRCSAHDETIIEWAAKSGTVLVTADEDFQGAWVRQGTMKKFGTEVVVFDFEPGTPVDLLVFVLKHLATWQAKLETEPYLHRVWVQPKRKPLYLRQGRKAKKKRRQPEPPRRPPVAPSIVADTIASSAK